MKKFLKIAVIIIVFALLVVDFVGLWKYKLSGKKYELATASDDVAVNEIGESDVDTVEYTELTSKTMKNYEKLFIKNIEEESGKYLIKGLLYQPYEISKEDYTALRAGKSVEIFGISYQQSQIKANNLILKSSDKNAKNYYIKYDTTSKKYILKDTKTDYEIYQSTDKYVKLSVAEGTDFSIEKNGKTEKTKIEKVLETHKNLKEPEKETEKINICTLTFDKKGECTKITETCRQN